MAYCERSFHQAGDSSAEELASATQLSGPVLPISAAKPVPEIVEITDELKEAKGYYKLRLEQMNKRLAGIRKKRAAEAEKEEKK